MWCLSGTECVVAIELFLCRFTDQYVIAVILNTSYNVKLRVQHDAAAFSLSSFREDVDLCIPSLLCLPSDHERRQHPIRPIACDQAKLTNSSHTNKSLSNTKTALPSHREGQDSRWGPGDQAGPENDNIEKL